MSAFRQEIDISAYDFSTAVVKLVGSLNGRFRKNDFDKFGMKRLEKIFNDSGQDRNKDRVITI